MIGRKVDERRRKRPGEVPPEPVVRTCGLDHVVLHVRDLEASRTWYIRVLGLRPYFECEGHCFLRTGNCQIGLFEDLEPQTYHELDHVCLRTELDEQELREALARAEIPLLARPNGRGWQATPDRGIYIADPDGHVLQVLPRGQWPQVLVNVQPGRRS